jgi:hypothetical protein
MFELSASPSRPKRRSSDEKPDPDTHDHHRTRVYTVAALAASASAHTLRGDGSKAVPFVAESARNPPTFRESGRL